MPFAILPTARRPITTPTTQPSPTSFTYTFATSPPFSHLVVFLLPDVVLPVGTGAAVYLSVPREPAAGASGALDPGGGGAGAGVGVEGSASAAGASAAGHFKFLGALGPGKDSAVFKINLPGGGVGNAAATATSNPFGDIVPEIDMDAPEAGGTSNDITIGISIEPLPAIEALMQTMREETARATKATGSARPGPGPALPVAKTSPAVPTTAAAANTPTATTTPTTPGTTLHLARMIIHSAFNHLASCEVSMPPSMSPSTPAAASTSAGTGAGYVPLRAFRTWWDKFETRLRTDPGFLGRLEAQERGEG